MLKTRTVSGANPRLTFAICSAADTNASTKSKHASTFVSEADPPLPYFMSSDFMSSKRQVKSVGGGQLLKVATSLRWPLQPVTAIQFECLQTANANPSRVGVADQLNVFTLPYQKTKSTRKFPKFFDTILTASLTRTNFTNCQSVMKLRHPRTSPSKSHAPWRSLRKVFPNNTLKIYSEKCLTWPILSLRFPSRPHVVAATRLTY